MSSFPLNIDHEIFANYPLAEIRKAIEIASDNQESLEAIATMMETREPDEMPDTAKGILQEAGYIAAKIAESNVETRTHDELIAEANRIIAGKEARMRFDVFAGKTPFKIAAFDDSKDATRFAKEYAKREGLITSVWNNSVEPNHMIYRFDYTSR